jgi:hypothetical protein
LKETVLSHTTSDFASWYIIPADIKWAARRLVADIVSTSNQNLDLSSPVVSPKGIRELESGRDQLMKEP